MPMLEAGVWLVSTLIHGQRQDEKFAAPSEKANEVGPHSEV